MSELGGYLKPAYQAPAGTKGISRLLHAKGWAAEMIETYLWVQAEERVEALVRDKQPVLVVWDESVIEKAESIALEGLCAVRSSKARRLKRIKPGYFNPSGGRPVCVSGYHWLQVLVMGLEGPVTVAHFGWWSTQGKKPRIGGVWKLKFCGKSHNSGGNRGCMSGTGALPERPGWLSPMYIMCALSYVGRNTFA